VGEVGALAESGGGFALVRWIVLLREDGAEGRGRVGGRKFTPSPGGVARLSRLLGSHGVPAHPE